MMKPVAVLVFFLMAAGWTARASAQQRPLITEDPETIGAGRVLLEGGLSFENDVSNEVSGVKGDISRIGTFGVSVGLNATTEVQMDGGLVQHIDINQRLPNAPLATRTLLLPGATASSLEDIIVATKIRVASETPKRPAVGVRFGTKLPFADPTKVIGSGTTDFFASLLIAKTVQSVRTVGNVGLLVLGNPADGQDSARSLGFGVSIARALTNEFEMVGEVNGRLDPFEEIVPAGLESRSVFRLAGRYTYRMLRLDFGILVGMTNAIRASGSPLAPPT